ncbi:MAG: extracellular solute-binding protein [Hyphomicrobiaceae bacterium]
MTRLRNAFAVSLLVAGVLATPAAAEPRHGLSIFGDLKYPAGFKHFDYVNPDAPKGGRLTTVGPRTFDSFNGYILKGDAATGLSLLVDTLMASAGDEPSSMYGLVAESADVAADKLSVVFKLRPEAKFADGSPVTSDDVVFTFDTLKEKGHPSYRIMMRDVTRAEALGPHAVKFSFQGTQVRDLPLTVAGLPVLSKAYYATQAFDETTLKPPLGSGPYRIADFKQGNFVTYKRRDDYWAKDLPVNRGRWNFDEIRFLSFRDRAAELEDVKAGNMDLREEFTAKDWVTAYDIPAVKDGRLKRLTLPDNNPSGAQGFFINTRKAKFSDPRVRKALDYAFDYQWMNRNLFYDLYTRTESYFENSDMKATGKPSPEELAILEPYRAKLPAEVFGEAYRPPVTDGSGSDRRRLREAQKLLFDAGWKIGSGGGETRVRNAKGETLDLEFLINEPTFERILTPYIQNLKAIGINASIRRVDSAQYERRVKSYDFDIVTSRFVMSLTPGTELRSYWSSEAAKSEGSRNLAGISSPVIDALIEKIVAAKSRQELVVTTRAMDRILRASHYWVPHWFKAAHNIAYWDRLARPGLKPKYDRGVIDTWWYDAAKAAKLPPK